MARFRLSWRSLSLSNKRVDVRSDLPEERDGRIDEDVEHSSL
jgi:hypothetical protein